ncbi:uncharacterized protein LOC125501832 [Athalia rosae]|uniref:uncharacterized protein LOC125501832 n=1 Tax=Athalia rosae TaxID=37344 RepID=UPI002033764A|nr:uncharacterized protein LOC125501832 [Athalia rosae]
MNFFSYRNPFQILCLVGSTDWADMIVDDKFPMAILSYVIATSFLLLALHVTRSVDFAILTECGSSEFLDHVKSQLLSRIQSELPSKRLKCNRKGCRCRSNCVRCRSRDKR